MCVSNAGLKAPGCKSQVTRAGLIDARDIVHGVPAVRSISASQVVMLGV